MNVFGSTRNNTNNLDTSIFVQKFYLRTGYFEYNFEKGYSFDTAVLNRNATGPTNHFEALNKNYVDQNVCDYVPIRVRNNIN